MSTFLFALLIFFMRVTDQSVGTVRIVMLFRGRRAIAGVLAFFESLIWVVAVAQVVTNLDSPLKVVAFAGGFAAGNMLGSTIEQWLAVGKGLLRVVSPFDSPQAVAALRRAGFGATVVNAEGRDGPVRIAFSVIPRKRVREALTIVRDVNPDAWVTFEDIQTPDLALVRAPRFRK